MSRSISILDREIKSGKEDLKKQGIRKATLVSKLSSYLVIELDDGKIIKKVVAVGDVQHHIVDLDDSNCSSKTLKNEEFKPPE